MHLISYSVSDTVQKCISTILRFFTVPLVGDEEGGGVAGGGGEEGGGAEAGGGTEGGAAGAAAGPTVAQRTA